MRAPARLSNSSPNPLAIETEVCRAPQVARVSAHAGQCLQAVRLVDDDDLGELAITRAARPARHLEDVVHDVIGNRLALEVPNRPEAAQEIGEPSGIRCFGHDRYQPSKSA